MVFNSGILNPAYIASSNDDEYQLTLFVKGRVTESEYKELRSVLGSKLIENLLVIWTDLSVFYFHFF